MYLPFSGCCYFLSAVVNPFLYSLLSKRFRRGYHDLVRNTKIWFRNLPILLHITSPPTTTKESDRIVSVDLVPSIHTSSQQGRDCIVNNMCCSGTVIKKAVYKFNTNSKKIQDNRQSIYLSPNSNINTDQRMKLNGGHRDRKYRLLDGIAGCRSSVQCRI